MANENKSTDQKVSAESEQAKKESESSKSESNQTPKFVTLEEHQAILKRLDGLSAIVREFKDKEKTVVKTDATLEERVKGLEVTATKQAETAAKQQERETLHVLKTTFIDAGIDAGQAERFAKLTILENKSNIVVDDDMKVFFKEGESQTPLAAWGKAFLQTDQGKPFFPTRNNVKVDVNGSAAASGSARKVTRADMRAGLVDPKDLLSGKAVVVD